MAEIAAAFLIKASARNTSRYAVLENEVRAVFVLPSPMAENGAAPDITRHGPWGFCEGVPAVGTISLTSASQGKGLLRV